MIRSCGLPLPIRLRAVVHPILLDQYAGLTRALSAIWAELGVEVEVATRTMSDFIDAWLAKDGFDLLLGPLDRGLQRPRQLHLHALPLRQRRGARLLLLRRVRPPPGGGAQRGASGRARGPLPEVRARADRSRDRHPALPRRRLPDRRPARPQPPAPERGPVRQLRGARKGGGGRRTARPRTGRPSAAPCTCRSRASSGLSTLRSARPRS